MYISITNAQMSLQLYPMKTVQINVTLNAKKDVHVCKKINKNQLVEPLLRVASTYLFYILGHCNLQCELLEEVGVEVGHLRI